MHTPEEFAQQWLLVSSSELVTYIPKEMTDTTLQLTTKSFLALGGLPKETSHTFMEFDQKSYQPYLRHLKDFLRLERDDFVQYYAIGNLEHGIICINANDQDKIVVIDIEYPADVDNGSTRTYREDQPDEQFMNSSVAQLAECLLAYERFWHAESISPESAEQMRTALKEIDPPCMEKWTFWWRETQHEVLFEDPL